MILSKCGRKRRKEFGISHESICDECGQNEIWNKKKLVLHLDHIDGNRHNHHVNNLRWLCPNCHSQTETFCSKNRIKNGERGVKFLLEKKEELLPMLETHSYLEICEHFDICVPTLWRCLKLLGIKKPIVNKNKKRSICVPWEQLKEELPKLIPQYSFVAIAKYYNVSDNAVRKWCKKLHIDVTNCWANANLGKMSPPVKPL